MAFQFGALRNNFFDSEKIIRLVDRGRRKALSKCGAFVRTRAKSSVRYRKQVSAAGSPPSAHRSERFTRKKRNRKTGAEKKQPSSPLRELIYFAYDPRTETVVVGPEAFRNAKTPPGMAPAALEKGGESRKVTSHGLVPIHVQARPFMRPAEEAERSKFVSQFKEFIR